MRTLEVSERDREIAALRESGLTLRAIGEKHGLTRARVGQILQKVARATGRRRIGPPKPKPRGRVRIVRPCQSCGRTDGKEPHDHYCRACRFETRYCGYCGRKITRDMRGANAAKYRAHPWFCSMKCVAKWRVRRMRLAAKATV